MNLPQRGARYHHTGPCGTRTEEEETIKGEGKKRGKERSRQKGIRQDVNICASVYTRNGSAGHQLTKGMEERKAVAMETGKGGYHDNSTNREKKKKRNRKLETVGNSFHSWQLSFRNFT